MLGTMMEYPLTVTGLLERAGKLFGRVEIVSRRPDRQLERSNYTNLYRRAKALAAALETAGMGRGDRVAALMWNHSRHLEAYLGVPAAGCVHHTLNLRLHPDELAFIAKHAGDRVLLIDDVLLPVYEKMRDRVPFERVIVAPTTGAPAPAGYESYEDFLATGAGDYQFPGLDENEAAAMCYTSGTTGVPKGVVYTHRSIVLHSFAMALGDCTGLKQNDVLLPIVPMFHANAWGLPHVAAMVGCKVVLPGPHLDAASVLDLMDGERVTCAAGVPTVWMGVVDALEQNPGRWKLQPGVTVMSGGSAVSDGLIRALDRHGMEARQAWGMTEMSPLGTFCTVRSFQRDLPEEEQVAIRARQGPPAPFVDLRATIGSTEIPWDGETLGELQVRGPWVASSYHNLPEQADRWTDDGWFCTGDVVSIDADGYVRIADRTKDLIKSGGEWISSVDLENALMGHAVVKEAAVIAVPHPKWIERPLAAVVLRDGVSATGEELREFLSAKFSKWQLPDAVVFVEEIPRTSVGKFQKSKLRERFAGWEWSNTAASL